MAKIIHCRDVGFDCDGVIVPTPKRRCSSRRSNTHRKTHGVDEITDEMIDKVKAAMQDA